MKKQRRCPISLVDKRKRLQALYQKVDRGSGGVLHRVLHILVTTIKNFGESRGPRAAAAMAYYALFSLFPLLVVLIAASGLLLNEQQATARIEEAIMNILPGSQSLIRENINNMMSLRNTVGLVGLVGLVWSASGVFSVLVANINLAWEQSEERGFLQQRLLALVIIVILIIVLLILPLLTSTLNLLPSLTLQLFKGTIIEKPIWFVFSNLIPFLVTFAALMALYRWAPKAKVAWKEAFWGSLFSAFGLLLVNQGFTFYLSSGLSRYQLIYGTLGAVVALMTWIYLSSLILILGAHLCSAVSKDQKRK